MKTVALALVCLVCAGHGRRMQIMESVTSEEDALAMSESKQFQSHDQSILAALLLSQNPAAAFTTLSSGAHLTAGDRKLSIPRATVRTPPVSRTPDALMTADERYSIADQVARFGRAKEQKNERYLNIESVYKSEDIAGKMKGKRVLVIGATRGVGLEIVKRLTADGAVVIATGRSPSEALDAAGPAQIITGVEVTDGNSLAKMCSQIDKPLDYVIFNAGYFPEITDNLDSMQEFEALEQIDICALGPLRAVAALKAGGLLTSKPKLVIITSQAGSALWRFTQNKDKGGDYGHHMSRAACNIGVVLMSEELKALEVPIVMLHPGFSRTDMTAKYSHIWDEEGAVAPAEGAMRVVYETSKVSMASTGKFINCEDGLEIPF